MISCLMSEIDNLRKMNDHVTKENFTQVYVKFYFKFTKNVITPKLTQFVLYPERTLGEPCGACECGDPFHAGRCEEGLECVHDDDYHERGIADVFKTCKKKGKKYNVS